MIGSQAILGQYPNAPEALLVSQEADIYAPARPDLSDAIDGALGQDSRFDRTFGYYADGVEPATATLPKGWEERLVPIHNENTDGATGWCLEVHDIAVAKYFANREKDRRYTRDLWREGLIDARTLEERLRDSPISHEVRGRIRSAARRDRAGPTAWGTQAAGHSETTRAPDRAHDGTDPDVRGRAPRE